MEQDIHKIAEYLERVTREGLAIEEKLLEWKSVLQDEVVPPEPQLAKAS